MPLGCWWRAWQNPWHKRIAAQCPHLRPFLNSSIALAMLSIIATVVRDERSYVKRDQVDREIFHWMIYNQFIVCKRT
jgi:hypothetical protein